MADRTKLPETAAIQGATIRFGEVKIRDRGRLPHWEKEAGLYFVTFRLADSLPVATVKKIAERRRILNSAKRSGLKLLPHQEALLADCSPKRIEETLDRAEGACYLREARIADVVADSLRYWDTKKYRLIAWCIMPNHVHVIFRLFPGQDLPKVVHSWKTYSAKMANQLLNRSGSFWQREYYDRLVRDGEELERAISYVLRNPEQAGLAAWQWVWSADVDVRRTAGLETGATSPGPV